ncbi:hypothetical protein ASG25_17540 [Rhizobium sp. Leaf384]|uniref:hypothetical protein n=1 Tax=Rhizobium sp. Leaf384 TaxID=1736358 RepID=UPI000713BB0F|nr:hypothetical protein [Rhizobium sp. Leaf384]KQS77167.1 hypothetical protein ASG25_17540 [Rhizobium sp. Leaf384]
MEKVIKKRRAKGQAAIGDIHATKLIVTSMIEDELKQRQAKTQKLKEMRLAAAKDAASPIR